MTHRGSSSGCWDHPEINDLKRAELDLQHLATHDQLTDLPNRYLLIDRLGHTLAHAVRSRSIFAVFFLDVDDFKAVNDAHGHDFGDRRRSRSLEPLWARFAAATPWLGSAATSS